MAQYLVVARPKLDRMAELRRLLEREAFASMKPFGDSLSYSLNNARQREDGYAVWEEEDYCSPPLAQERAAVLDEFFEELTVAPVEAGRGWDEIQNLPSLFPDLATRS